MAGQSGGVPGLGRILRLAALGLLIGAASGFIGALLRPRRWMTGEADTGGGHGSAASGPGSLR